MPELTPTRHSGPGRLSSLDGLRALAVLLVMAGHADLHYLERAGGPVGVTTFFVLSGFLITSMLMNEFVRTERLDLRTFYWKRFVRLAPALVVMVVLTTIVGLIGALGWRVVRDAFASLLYVSNWTQALFGDSVPQLSITWSLAVEEQYYLVWPLLLLPLMRRWGLRRLPAALAVVCVISLAWRALLTEILPVTTSYRLVTVNAFPLMVGGLLAALVVAYERRSPGPSAVPKARSVRWLREGAVVLLCALLGLLAAEPVVPAPVQLWISVPVTLVAAVIIWLCRRGGSVVLGWAPIAWLGRISYSLYLWHLGLMRLPGLPILLAWPLSIGVAALSWRFVEEPARRLLLARGTWFRRAPQDETAELKVGAAAPNA